MIPKPFDATDSERARGLSWRVGGTLGWTGLVLFETVQNPGRLVYGSAALVASLRGQQSHFATLPMMTPDLCETRGATRREK